VTDFSVSTGVDTAAPRGWRRVSLSEVCEITARQVDPRIPEYGALPHVNGENIEGGTCRLTHLATAQDAKLISGQYLFESGDVLYSKLRPYLRKVIVATFRGVCSADMYPIHVQPDFLLPEYLALQENLWVKHGMFRWWAV
jgi:type I restriction enzyme S subunit